MKNQRLVEAMNDLIIKRVKAHRSIYWSVKSIRSIWSACSSYELTYSVYNSASHSAFYSEQLDKQAVLEIIKGKLK